MKILLTIAWRNIWRNRGRSGALLSAIIVGLWAGVLTVGLMSGVVQQRMDYMIESEITHLQLHHQDFRAERRPELVVENFREILNWLEEREEVKSHTARTLAEGMLQSPVKTSGVRIMGVNPETEQKTTTFHENLTEGEYLDADLRNPVFIGQSLAREHRMELGDRVVLTFERVDGELSSAAFNIAGIFRSGSTQYDDAHIFVKSTDLSELMSDEKIIHEIAVMLRDESLAENITKELNEQFGPTEALTWDQLSPELGTLALLGGFMLFLVTMVIMIALAFGILNTMLMALFERIREIGMLISIGMSRFRVFIMVVLEAIVITLIGSMIGILLAWVTMLTLGKSGVNLELFAGGIEEIGWPTVIYPSITTEEFILIVIIVVVMTVLASLYPAWKAFKVNPMEIEKDT